MFSFSKRPPVKLFADELPSFSLDEVESVQEIGAGSFAVVSSGVHKDKEVVVKVFKSYMSIRDKKLIAKEAKLLNEINHENINKVIAVSENPAAIMLELCEFSFKPFDSDECFSNLDQLLEFIHTTDIFNVFVPKLSYIIASHLVTAVAFLHDRDIVHRDIKPSNCLVSNLHYSSLNKDEIMEIMKNQPIVIKLADLGEARSNIIKTKALQTTNKTLNGSTKYIERGSSAFMAPELLVPNLKLTSANIAEMKKTDIWAMLMTFFLAINPDQREPYENDGVVDEEGLIDIIRREQLPSSSLKYRQIQDTQYQMLVHLIKQNATINPAQRGTAADLFNELQQEIDAESIYLPFTATALGQNHNACAATHDGTALCAFITLGTLDVLAKFNLDTLEHFEMTSLIESGMTDFPAQFNSLGSVHDLYDISKTYDILMSNNLLMHTFTFPKGNLKKEELYSRELSEHLVNELTQMEEAAFQMKKQQLALYLGSCSNFAVGVTPKGVFLAIDTRTINEDGNGVMSFVTSKFLLVEWLISRTAARVTAETDSLISFIPMTYAIINEVNSADDLQILSVTDCDVTGPMIVAEDFGQSMSFKKMVDVCVNENIHESMVKSAIPFDFTGRYHASILNTDAIPMADIATDGIIYNTRTTLKDNIDITYSEGNMVDVKYNTNGSIMIQRKYTKCLSTKVSGGVLKRVITSFKSLTSNNWFRYVHVCYKVNIDGGMKMFRRAHGNAKSDRTYIKTCPSVMARLKELAKNNSPKEVIATIDRETGGPMEMTNPTMAVRNREQMYNINRKLKRKKSRNTGPIKASDYTPLYAMLSEGSFVKNVEFVANGDGEVKPLIFATTSDHLKMINQYANATQPAAVLGIDMTYRCGPFYATLFVLPHPLFKWRSRNEVRNPTVVTAIGVSFRKQEEDYKFFSDKLKSHLKHDTLVYGTDGEPALEKSMERYFPIEGVPQGKASIHLRCFEHVKEDMKNALSESGLNDDQARDIMNRILGQEIGGLRKEGLVDCQTEYDFERNFEQLKKELPEKFLNWLNITKNRTRSVVETMKRCMLANVRTAAGLGDPPNKFINNRCEAMNLVTKEAVGYSDVVRFLEVVKEMVFDAQVSELIKAIHNGGEYELVDEVKHQSVDAFEWSRFSRQQKEKKAEEVLSLTMMEEDGDMKTMPLTVDQIGLVPQLPLSSLKLIWRYAAFLRKHAKTVRIDDTHSAIHYDEKYFQVKSSDTVKLRYICNCAKYKAFDGLCGHIIALSDTKEDAMMTINNYVQFGGNMSKIMANVVPKGGGEKSGRKKERRGKNNIRSTPITQVVKNTEVREVDFEPSETPSGLELDDTSSEIDPTLDIPKDFVKTQPWHNQSPFFVHLLTDGWCRGAKFCESCRSDFPVNQTVEAQIILIHSEISTHPKDKEGTGPLMAKAARRFYCSTKRCLLRRHPYFWKGLLKVTQATKKKLKEVHYDILNENLHYVH